MFFEVLSDLDAKALDFTDVIFLLRGHVCGCVVRQIGFCLFHSSSLLVFPVKGNLKGKSPAPSSKGPYDIHASPAVAARLEAMAALAASSNRAISIRDSKVLTAFMNSPVP